ncbi:MAG: hypothetical protein K6G04_02040 [Lachnospiraceae bacterium]|nr:hypothetical protein [Lachnospiraceae bacterium]
MQQFLSDLKIQEKVRESLRGLIDELKNNPEAATPCLSAFSVEEWCFFLENEDAKARKNALGLLALLPWPSDAKSKVCDRIVARYLTEDTLFVREAYVKALASFDCAKHLVQLQERFDALTGLDFPAEDLKHIRKERAQLGQLLARYQTKRGHRRNALPRGKKWLLRSEGWLLDLLQSEYPEGKRLPFGLLVDGTKPSELVNNRLYEQLLLMVPQSKEAPIHKDAFREGFLRCGILSLLRELFAEDQPFAFRLDIYGKYDPEVRVALVKKAAAALEDATGGYLYNAPSDYEIEVVLFPRRDGSFGMFLWPGNFGEERFSYRKCTSAVSMAPQKAAAAAQIAKPFLKEGVFRLDGFCGEGTLLIECQRVAKAREVFGCDIFGDGIRGGRENAQAAGVDIHFVQRDFFDFTNRQAFGELVGEFPDLFHKEAGEKDDFFRKFFQRALELTMEESTWMVITSEENLLKKYVRLHEQLTLKLQAPFGKEKALYIIRRQENGLDKH